MGARRANRVSISAAWGNATSPRVTHSGCTNTSAGRRLRRMSLMKASTFPSSGVGFAKEGVTN